MRQRQYELNGAPIHSSEVNGFLHTARTDRGSCMACSEPVSKGMEYVTLNIFGGSDPIHKDCYLADHPEKCILGVKTVTDNHMWFSLPTRVICQDFSKKSVEAKNTK